MPLYCIEKKIHFKDEHLIFYISGQLYAKGLDKPVLISTPESSPIYDDSYMGYSVTVGDFAGQAMQGVAVGVPRGSELRGLVRINKYIIEDLINSLCNSNFK